MACDSGGQARGLVLFLSFAAAELRAGFTFACHLEVITVTMTALQMSVPQENVRALTKGVQAVMGYKPGSGPVSRTESSSKNEMGKPWKKHGNRNKKEKVRRLTKHLDA